MDAAGASSSFLTLASRLSTSLRSALSCSSSAEDFGATLGAGGATGATALGTGNGAGLGFEAISACTLALATAFAFAAAAATASRAWAAAELAAALTAFL